MQPSDDEKREKEKEMSELSEKEIEEMTRKFLEENGVDPKEYDIRITAQGGKKPGSHGEGKHK
ncbi:MAG: hypothetical protein FJZ63_00985 [Chlamydiae bacterium]|nr:hypothetical protein [Chlamydiota bacterium]